MGTKAIGPQVSQCRESREMRRGNEDITLKVLHLNLGVSKGNMATYLVVLTSWFNQNYVDDARLCYKHLFTVPYQVQKLFTAPFQAETITYWF